VKSGNKKKIGISDAQTALDELQSEISRMIEVKDQAVLKEIYYGQKAEIGSREGVLGLLQSRAVMEYNGKRWCDLHPLVEDLFRNKWDKEKVLS